MTGRMPLRLLLHPMRSRAMMSVTFNAAFSNENVADNKVISLSSLS